MIVNHDDPEREYEYAVEKVNHLAAENNWHAISMKKDWERVLDLKKMNKQLRTFLAILGLLTIVWAAEVDTAGAADFQPLMGRWQRTDAGYVIEISRIDADGNMAAGYFNPRPINVSQALASMQKSYIKVEVELRDTGYPGSRYTLIYDQPKDRLIGFYYHAVSGQNFDVVFVRQK